MTNRRTRYIQFKDEIHQCGYLASQLKELMLFHFDSYGECADYFGYSETAVRNWCKTDKWPVAVARLLLTKHRGFMPTTREWRGFKIHGEYLTTPHGKTIHARDLALLHIDFRTQSNYPTGRFSRIQPA